MKLFTFTDNLEIVEGAISVDAEIATIPESEGGRHGPFTKGFRPNHNFGDETNRSFFIGQIEVEPDEWVYPGDTKNLSVTFLGAAGLRELLTIDRVWRIQEGPKLIGTGRVLSVSPRKTAPNKAE